MSFKNKVVLVTGGSSGIGAATAISFAREGADVAFVGRKEAKLKKVCDEIRKFGKEPLVIKADLSKDTEARIIIKQTVDKFGKLDVLVNNAGILRYATVSDENLLQVYDEVVNNNLRSIVLLTNLAVPYLVETKGNIVNISSVAALTTLGGMGLTGLAAYCTSKAGLDHFSRVAAVELAAKGVRVNIVNPGPVETDFIENAGEKSDWEGMAQQTPLKILTQPAEVADVILFLASDKAKSITGSSYPIDAGSLLIY